MTAALNVEKLFFAAAIDPELGNTHNALLDDLAATRCGLDGVIRVDAKRSGTRKADSEQSDASGGCGDNPGKEWAPPALGRRREQLRAESRYEFRIRNRRAGPKQTIHGGVLALVILIHRLLIRTGPRFFDVAFLAALACALGGVVPAGAWASRPIQLGFADEVFSSVDPAERAGWLDRTVGVGANIVRLNADWAGIAPKTRPIDFDASNPTDPAYGWQRLDAAVKDANRRGLRILITIGHAPGWAEGPGRARDAGSGTWRPNRAMFGAFARAIARRYSGRTRDPVAPGALPSVRYWQIWNEPNLSTYLTPQWVRRGARDLPAGASIYRGLLNAAYSALKAVDKHNFVITGGTAPFGDLTPARRTPPVAFLRELLCETSRLKRGCRHAARFDALAHHPYGVGGPTQHALNHDDVAVPDLGKLTRVVRAAVRDRTALPARRKQLWVTEISWDSNPPDPYGVPEARHARWLEQAIETLWKQGVDVMTWFQVRDQAEGEGWQFGNQSGVFLRDGRPKRAATAFHFPFVAKRVGRGVRYWLRAPATGTITIQTKVGGRWHASARRRVRRGGVLASTLSHVDGTHLRAALGSELSLNWRL